MSRVALALAAAALAAFGTVPAVADPPVSSTSGLPISPYGGMTGVHQWGGIDDSFAVNPEAGDAPAPATHKPEPQSRDGWNNGDSAEPDRDEMGGVYAI